MSRTIRSRKYAPLNPASRPPAMRSPPGAASVPDVSPHSYVRGVPIRDQNSPRPPRIGYLLPFEIVSVHLLVVLIGAAYLARAKRRAKAPATSVEISV